MTSPHPSTKRDSHLWACALAAAVALSACTYGKVMDEESGSPNQFGIGGASVRFSAMDVRTPISGPGRVSLASPVVARTWSGLGQGRDGIYYLNPFAPRTPGDTTPVVVSGGWNRVLVSADGYEQRRYYINHQYVPHAASTKNPYSAGPYPYQGWSDDDPSNLQNAQTSNENFYLRRVGSSHDLHPDLIPDARALQQWKVETSSAACAGRAARCLRMPVGFANVGDGPLVVSITRDGALMFLEQTLYSTSGTRVVSIANNPAAELRLRPFRPECSAELEAWRCDPVASGTVSIDCLQDTQYTPYAFDDELFVPPERRVSFCTGFRDHATFGLTEGAGAWIERTTLGSVVVNLANVPPGDYWLELEVNPANNLTERTRINNATRLKITL